MTVDYVCEHGSSGQVTAQVTIRQYRVELLDDDGNALTVPPQPQQTNYGNSAPFQVYISQRYSIAGPSYSPPVTLRFADYPVGTGGLGGDLTYVASEQRSADGTYVIGDSGTNRVFGYGLSSAKNDVELDIRIARAGDGSNWGIGHFHRFTVCKIVAASVLAYSGNDALDDNPVANGDGLRVYPGKQTPSESDSMHRDYVSARVDITPLVPDQVVWFRKFDPDDPTANGVNNVLDPAYTAAARNGADNFPWDASNNSTDPAKWITGNPPPAGTPNAAEWRWKETDAAGRVDLDFQVGLNAGNNYIYTGSLEYQYLADSRVRTSDGLSVEHTPDFASLPTASPSANVHAAASESLFVWRRLHLELDTMAGVSATEFADESSREVWIESLRAETGEAHVRTWYGRSVSSPDDIQGDDGSPALPDGDGRWQMGDLDVAGTVRDGVIESNYPDGAVMDSPQTLTVTLEKGEDTENLECEYWTGNIDGDTEIWLTTEAAADYVGGTLTVTGTSHSGSIESQSTSDDGKSELVLTGEVEFKARLWEDDDKGLAVSSPRGVGVGKMQESDDHGENVFALAFIKPKVDGGGSGANSEDDISADLYIDPSDWQSQIDTYWDSKSDKESRYWIAYVVSVYQGPRSQTTFMGWNIAGDYDPSDELALGGYGFETGGALVFSETSHDLGRANNWTAQEQNSMFDYAAPHEIGHQFGAGHDGVSNTIMKSPYWSDPDGEFKFAEVTLLQFRRHAQSPGDRP